MNLEFQKWSCTAAPISLQVEGPEKIMKGALQRSDEWLFFFYFDGDPILLGEGGVSVRNQKAQAKFQSNRSSPQRYTERFFVQAAKKKELSRIMNW